jgi:hypothetical protein
MSRRLVSVLVSLGFVVMPACGWPLGPRPQHPYFLDFRPYADPQPPQRGLALWVEGDSLTPDTAGNVRTWPDMRGGGTVLRAWTAGDGTTMPGTIASATLRTPAGLSRMLRGLQCTASPRCSYVLADGAGRPRRDLLTGSPYAILTVVRRAGPRGDNYVVMTDGTGCDPVTGIRCTDNTALHLGWSGEDVLRLGQYGNDVVWDGTTRFNGAAPALSLLEGVSNGDGKRVSILELLYDTTATAPDTRPLDRSGSVFVGGTPFVDNNPVPNWHFEGVIFAVLIYNAQLTPDELRAAADYLRNRYGPR